MPGAADTGLQEPEHELAVVQQVQKGSISSAGTKAQLTVKLPGVSSADDVQVRCTISSVSVAVPGRYRLHLFLPFCVKDEAESVKFSGKKQPPTLAVTLAVESNIAPPAAAAAPPAAPQSAAARAFLQSSTGSSQGRRQHQGQQQQQQQQSSAANRSSSSMPASSPDGEEHDVARILQAGGPRGGPDRAKWLMPCALAADWMDESGGNAALSSLLWMLSPVICPPEDEPDDLLPLTLRSAVLALLTALLHLFQAITMNAYGLGCAFAQSCIYAILSASTAEPRVKAAFVTYTCALNNDNSYGPTLVKLVQSWTAYYWLWQLIKLLRVNVVCGWAWRYGLWPVLLSQLWRPRAVVTVPIVCLGGWVFWHYVPKRPLDDPPLHPFLHYILTQLVILLQGGGWQTVAALLLAASLTLPRLPKHFMWPFCYWRSALVLPSCVLAPAWPHRWQRWLAGSGLMWFVQGRILELRRIRQ